MMSRGRSHLKSSRCVIFQLYLDYEENLLSERKKGLAVVTDVYFILLKEV